MIIILRCFRAREDGHVRVYTAVWNKYNRGLTVILQERGAVEQEKADRLTARGRPSSAQPQRNEHDMFVSQSMAQRQV